MNHKNQSINLWGWQNMQVAWSLEGKEVDAPIATLLVHGFGACKEHWRHNQKILGEISNCYAIDLIGFGDSSQPDAKFDQESNDSEKFLYCFDQWAQQIADFCLSIINKPVIIVGNSIGGVIALKASQILNKSCLRVILIDCAQRTMDDKRLNEQSYLMKIIRPYLKLLVRQKWLSSSLFRNAANPKVINNILKIAYPSGNNIDNELIQLLYKPSRREGASEAFRGFINLFDDYLAPELMKDMIIPINMIWGEKDPWEPLQTAKDWMSKFNCICSLDIIPGAGHCPHDETPEIVNKLLLKIIQEAT